MEVSNVFTVCLLILCGCYVAVEYLRSQQSYGIGNKKIRPNFVIFFADDMGWGDLGSNWKLYENVTTNLNGMAKRGMRFTDFHVGASVCGPSRASLLTGRLGLRTGLISNFRPGSLGGLPTNETTLAEVLKTAGYNTGMIGKWHLGLTEKYQPNSRGFDYYYGLPYSNDMGCVDIPVYNRPPQHPCPTKSSEPAENGKQSAVPLYENRDIVEQPVDLINLGDHYASKSEDFILKISESDKPFFLYVAFAHMHLPHAHAPRFSNSTDVHTVYADTLHEMDDIIGRVLTSLDKYGYTDNTLIWFTSDNGPWLGKCQYSGSPGPFLGSWLKKTYGGGSTAKTTTWEAGHREPAIAVWPGRIRPGTVSDALVSSMDIFPTIVNYADAKMPPNRKFDGIDIGSILEGKSNNGHEVLYHPNSGVTHPEGEIDTIRMGSYKVYWKTGGSTGCSKSCDGKIAPEVIHNPPLLFNVEIDPAESTALTEKTEPKYHELLDKAQELKSYIVADIKADNTSVVDYSMGPKGYPCCDSTKFLCRCQRDKLQEFKAKLQPF